MVPVRATPEAVHRALLEWIVRYPDRTGNPADKITRFEAFYVVHESKKKTIADLKKALKDADELLLATDEDRRVAADADHDRDERDGEPTSGSACA